MFDQKKHLTIVIIFSLQETDTRTRVVTTFECVDEKFERDLVFVNIKKMKSPSVLNPWDVVFFLVFTFILTQKTLQWIV